MQASISEKWKQMTPNRRDRLTTGLIVATAFIIAILVTLFVFQSYRVDGQSMENTLLNNDRLIIFKLPRTWARITGHAYIPHRGDIIVFNETGLFGEGSQRQLIKRVVGLPGDRVVVNDGKIKIFNQANPSGFDPDAGTAWSATMASGFTSGSVNVTLGSNQIYVMGDNRPDSSDSRVFGPINPNQIIGKLDLRILPLSKAQSF